jgi:hypothetical protein
MGKAWRESNLAAGTREIASLPPGNYKVQKLTDFQYRFNDRLDIFPVRRRYHDIKLNVRGDTGPNLELFLKKYFEKPLPEEPPQQNLFAGGQFDKGKRFMSGWPWWEPLWVRFGKKASR